MASSAPELSPRAREIVAAARKLLEAAVISDGFLELAAVLDGSRAETLADGYRGFAHAHPHRYRLMTEGPLARDLLTPGAEDAAAAAALEAMGGDRDGARALWAFAHGMTILELDGRFPPGADLDAAWASGLAAFGSLQGWRRRPGTTTPRRS